MKVLHLKCYKVLTELCLHMKHVPSEANYNKRRAVAGSNLKKNLTFQEKLVLSIYPQKIAS